MQELPLARVPMYFIMDHVLINSTSLLLTERTHISPRGGGGE
jgi:hypothetical protein